MVLHGGPGASHDYLLPQMLRLAERYEVVLYDQRGGGRSRARDDTPVTWRTQVDDLRLVLAELGFGEAPRLVGYSWGAVLALLYTLDAVGAPFGGGNPYSRGAPPNSEDARGGTADRHQSAASRTDPASAPLGPFPSSLTLISPAPLTRRYRAQFEAEFLRRSMAPAVARLREELAASGLRERDPEAYRQSLFELGVAGYFCDPRNAHDLTPFRVTARVQQSVWQSLGDFDLVSPLGAVRAAGVPALVVVGRDDPIPVSSAVEGARALGARLVVLEQCGHVPYVEQPEALFAALERFLSEQAGAPR
jgi:proline iminopeptidase